MSYIAIIITFALNISCKLLKISNTMSNFLKIQTFLIRVKTRKANVMVASRQ